MVLVAKDCLRIMWISKVVTIIALHMNGRASQESLPYQVSQPSCGGCELVIVSNGDL